MKRRWCWGLIVAGLPAVAVGEEPRPKVVAAWAAGLFEARVAFDRPISEADAQAAVGRIITFDETRPNLHVAAPAEASRPLDSRGSLHIAAARRANEGRTLVLVTDPHPRAAAYETRLPIAGGEVAVAYDLTGVEAAWDDGTEGATPSWIGWWQGLDPVRVRETLGGSAEHAASLARLAKPGRLTLTALVPLPEGSNTIRVASDAFADGALDGEGPSDMNPAVFKAESSGVPSLLTLTLKTSEKSPPTVHVTLQEGDKPARPLAPDELLVPWAPVSSPPPAPMAAVPDVAGGDAKRGAQVFVSEEAKCAHCHRVRGVGGVVGPDLSVLVGRDRLQVYRDVAEPSARIHPDFVPYTVALKNGRVLVGTVKAEGADRVRVTDTEAKVTTLTRDEVEEYRPSATSIMPVGLAGAIGEERLRDLIAFLTSDTPPAPLPKPAGGD